MKEKSLACFLNPLSQKMDDEFETESQDFCTFIYTQGTVRCLAKARWFVFDQTGGGHYS